MSTENAKITEVRFVKNGVFRFYGRAFYGQCIAGMRDQEITVEYTKKSDTRVAVLNTNGDFIGTASCEN